MKKKIFFDRNKIIKILIILAIMSYILIKYCDSNVLAYGYKSTNNYGGTKYAAEMVILLIIIVYSLWKSKNSYIRYIKYKKMKVNEGKAIITSFNGAVYRRRYLSGYTYSYKYNVDNETHIRKYCKLKDVYNKGDIIKILYDAENPDVSITKEEYNEAILKRNILGYCILFGVSLVFFIALVYASI